MSYLRNLALGGLIFLPVAVMAEGNVNSNTWGLNLTRGVTLSVKKFTICI